MRPLASMVLLALSLAAGCGDDVNPGDPDLGLVGDRDLAQRTPICPPNVEFGLVPCTSSDKHCYTVGGVYPYGANCIGCDPAHLHWETDLVELICDGGTSD